MTFYDVLCQWNKQDGNCQNVVKCRKDVAKCRKLSCTPLCEMSMQALRRPTRHSRAHASHCDSPGEFGKLSKVFPKSAGPIRGAHSACACHAALSNVQDMGPHSSELAVLFAKEKGVPCRTRSWSLWLMIRLKMAWAPGAVLPNCSNTTGVMPLSKACRLYPSRCPYALHLVISSRRSSLATLRSGLTVWIFTSSQSSEPCGSMMCTSALWMGLTLPGAGCPSSWIWSGMSMACSVVAVRPACRASLVMRSLMRSCRRVCSPLVQHAACRP